MVLCAVLDKLCVMTYLYQLRSFFTGQTLEIQQICNNARESTYTVGEHDTDQDSRILKEMYGREVQMARKSPEKRKRNQGNKSKSPSPSKDERSAVSGAHLTSPVLNDQSPSQHRLTSTPKSAISPNEVTTDRGQPNLMTRRQLMNPFDSDDDEGGGSAMPPPKPFLAADASPGPLSPDDSVHSPLSPSIDMRPPKQPAQNYQYEEQDIWVKQPDSSKHTQR